MKRLSEANRKTIDELHAQGKSMKHIKEVLKDFSYSAIWNHINKDIVQIRNKKRYEAKPKPVFTVASKKYVPTNRPMPPTNPPSPLIIIVDKELAEVACKQIGLGPPVTTLANRPHNISHHGMRYVDGNWIANQNLNAGQSLR